MPAGFTLTSGGTLSGSPATTASYTIPVQVTDATGKLASSSYSLSIASAGITTTNLPMGAVGVPYSATLTARGVLAPLTWNVAGGRLPDGLQLSASGTLSGIPTASGYNSFTMKVVDSHGNRFSQPLGVEVVVPLGAPVSSLPSGTVGKSYQAALKATGGVPPYSWAITSGTLPSILTMNSAGTVSGTPSSNGNYGITARVSDSVGQTATGPVSIAIMPSEAISTTSLPNGTVGLPYAATLAVTGGVSPYAWSIASGSLPAGLSLSAAGAVSGTPAAAGSSNVTLKVSDSTGTSVSQSYTVSIASAPLTITTSTLPNATATVAYGATVTASGGTAPYTWTIASGLLPAGLSLSTVTGDVSGTATTAGTYSVSMAVTDSKRLSASASFSFVVLACGAVGSAACAAPPLTITSACPAGGTVGTTYSATLAGSGGTAPYSWALSSGALPLGLSLSSSGVISGTPSTAGSSGFVIGVKDSTAAIATQYCTLGIASSVSSGGSSDGSLTIMNADLPNGSEGSAYNVTLAASGGTGPYTWSVTSGSLPGGLALNSSTGVISGNPTTAGWSDLFDVQAQDSTGATTSLTYSVIVQPALDAYGGFTAQPCTATGEFHTQKVNNRWWFCTPAGNVYWNLSVGGMGGQTASGADTKTGITFDLGAINTAKYGDTTYNWGIAQNRRLQLWGFNGIGQLSSAFVKPMATGFSTGDGTQPVKMPMTDTLAVSNYAGVNLWGYGPRPLKNLAQGYSDQSRVWTGHGKAIMDYVDSSFQTYVSAFLAKDNAVQAYKNSPYTLGLFLDDTDWSWGFGAGPDFPTQPALGHNNSSPVYEVMVTSPVQRFQPNPAYSNFGVMYAEGRVFSKVAMASPPAECSTITPCSLRDYLYQKYNGSIAALNGAWGSNYTTFDSTGIPYSRSAIGTGDGNTTTFNFTLPNTPVSPYSIAVYVNGNQVGGDCPYYNAGCNSMTNIGSFMSPQGVWSAGQIYAQTYVVDPNGNLEVAQNTGNNGSAPPVWNTTPGGTTVAGEVTWTNLGPSIKSGLMGPWAADSELSASDCSGCGLPQASYWFQTTWHGVPSAPSREIGATYASGSPQITIGTQNNANDAPPGVTTVDIYVSCRVLSGSASHGCVAATDPQPVPTLQVAGVPYPVGSWTEPTDGLVNGQALPQPPSWITYGSGVGSISFNTAPPTGAGISVDFIAQGWPYGTGLMDEDGRNTSWLGTNDVCLTPHQLVCGPGLSFAAPNANPTVGADLEAWNAQFAASYFSQSKAAMTTTLPGILYFGTDTFGTWGAPPPLGVLQGAAPYLDAMFTTVYPGQTYSDPIYQFITQYLGDKPIMNFLTEQATPDSFLSPYGVQPAQVIGAPTQAQRGQNWSATINGMLNAQSYNGTYQWVGANWWGLYDFWSELTNWGLVSLNDNPYDGKSSCQQRRVDLLGYFTGGETPATGATCFGSATDYLKQANSLPYSVIGK